MLDFYIPLSLTQLLMLVANPIGSAAMSRMPLAIESLAAWPTVGAVRYITGGFGGAYNEVMVALVERERSYRPLRLFAVGLGVFSTAILAVLTIPGVSHAIFARLMDLADPLPTLIHRCTFILLPAPAIAVLQSYFQGIILHSRRTRSITESVAVFLVVASAALVAGVVWGGVTGIYVAMGSFMLGEAGADGVAVVAQPRDAARPARPRRGRLGGAGGLARDGGVARGATLAYRPRCPQPPTWSAPPPRACGCRGSARPRPRWPGAPAAAAPPDRSCRW